jgi:hypothetical protein
MSVLIGSWEFEGPYNELAQLRCEPGIIALLSGSNDDMELIAIEESDSVKDHLERKKLTGLVRKGSKNPFATAVYYCSDLNATLRQGLVDKLVKEFGDAD